jgi:hypothetical protein
MRTEVQNEFRKLLLIRVKRLVELLEISAPEPLIAKEVVLVLKAALAAMPELIGHILIGWLCGSVRNESNYCATCDLNVDSSSCTGQEAELAKDEYGRQGNQGDRGRNARSNASG